MDDDEGIDGIPPGWPAPDRTNLSPGAPDKLAGGFLVPTAYDSTMTFIDAYDAVQSLEEKTNMASHAMDLLDEALQSAADASGVTFEPRLTLGGEPALGSVSGSPDEAAAFPFPTTPATAFTDYIGKAAALAATVRSTASQVHDPAPQPEDLAAGQEAASETDAAAAGGPHGPNGDAVSVASGADGGAGVAAAVHEIYKTPGGTVSLDIGLRNGGDVDDSPPARGRRGYPERRSGSARKRAPSNTSASSGEASIPHAMLYGY